MKKTSVVMALLATLLMAHSAFALFAVRAHYGVASINPSSDSVPALKALPGFGADVILDLPLVPFGFGLRYEQLGGKVSDTIGGTNLDLEVKSTRTSLIINKRLIDTIAYLGVIGTLGLSHTNKITVSGLIDQAPTSPMSYTIGAEGGMSLLGLILGAEMGYQSLSFKDVGSTSSSYNMNGTYFKAMVGIGF